MFGWVIQSHDRQQRDQSRSRPKRQPAARLAQISGEWPKIEQSVHASAGNEYPAEPLVQHHDRAIFNMKK